MIISHFFPEQEVVLVEPYFFATCPHLVYLFPGLLLNRSEFSLEVSHRVRHVEDLVWGGQHSLPQKFVHPVDSFSLGVPPIDEGEHDQANHKVGDIQLAVRVGQQQMQFAAEGVPFDGWGYRVSVQFEAQLVLVVSVREEVPGGSLVMLPFDGIFDLFEQILNIQSRWVFEVGALAISIGVLQLLHLRLRDAFDLEQYVIAQDTSIGRLVVFEEFGAVDEDSANGLRGTFSFEGLDPVDDEVAQREDCPSQDKTPLHQPQLLELFDFGAVLVEDVVGLEHVLLELVDWGFPRNQRLLFEAVQCASLALLGLRGVASWRVGVGSLI